jgi:hypothetical protein
VDLARISGQNVPNSAASVSWEATFNAPSGLFIQFQAEVQLRRNARRRRNAILRIAEVVHFQKFVHLLAKAANTLQKSCTLPLKIHREFIGLCENAVKLAQIRALLDRQTCREAGTRYRQTSIEVAG